MKPYPKYYPDIIQGTDEWMQIKLGIVSASRFKDATAKGRGGGVSSTRNKLLNALAWERKYKQPYPEKFEATGAMQNGIDTEAEARDFASELFGVEIKQVGFIEYNDDIGCSPDGLIGENGLIEIKCPLLSTHMDYIKGHKSLITDYLKQVQGQLFVTGREWCYLVSYHPLNYDQICFWTKIKRDEEYIKKMHVDLVMFVNELKELMKEFNKSPF